MNKSDLIQAAAAKTGLSQQQARECLDAFLGAIGKEMKDGGEVVITDFGRFFTKKMPQRTVTLPDGRSSILMASCDSRDRVLSLAESDVRNHTECQGEPEILGVSEPDSAFGTGFLSQKEKESMMAVMQKVTATIMKRTNNMTEFNPDDKYVIDLAERQMKAMSEIRSTIYDSDKKGKWSGWKVRVDYQARNRSGMEYKSERWLFIDKEGKEVVRAFDIPLP